jgi:Zn-finger nucleic acid-binding protein
LHADEAAVEERVPLPSCPACDAPLEARKEGELDFWSCPVGHGVGFTMSEAYGRVQEDEIERLWQASASAPLGTAPCAWCGVPMARVTVGVHPDEAREGEPGDGPDTRELTVDVCREDQFFWFDPGELDQLPNDLPDPVPSAEEQREIDEILAEYDRALAEAAKAGDGGPLDRLADPLARRHPGFTRALEHGVYGDALDRLEEETERAERKLADRWHAGETDSAA